MLIKVEKFQKKISLSKKLLEKLIMIFPTIAYSLNTISKMLSNKKIFLKENYKKNKFEIGFGNGEFLIKNAISKPEELFIGVEVYLNGIVKVLSTISDFKLSNIF